MLRAFTNALEASLPLVPQLLETLEHMLPGEIVYLYADEALARKDARKGPPKTE